MRPAWAACKPPGWPLPRQSLTCGAASVHFDQPARAVRALTEVTLQISQGERVAMARAWALQPQVLLLDEPTASLDPHAKRELEALIEAFAGGPQAMTLIFASHNLGQVKRLASRVLDLELGRVLADLPVEDFFSGPLLQQQYPAAHLFVKGELV